MHLSLGGRGVVFIGLLCHAAYQSLLGNEAVDGIWRLLPGCEGLLFFPLRRWHVATEEHWGHDHHVNGQPGLSYLVEGQIPWHSTWDQTRMYPSKYHGCSSISTIETIVTLEQESTEGLA